MKWASSSVQRGKTLGRQNHCHSYYPVDLLCAASPAQITLRIGIPFLPHRFVQSRSKWEAIPLMVWRREIPEEWEDHKRLWQMR